MQYAIWVTNACNLRCRYCYEKEKRNVFMDRRTAEQIFLYIKKRSEVLYDNDIQINIHGGEPLLNYDILQYLVQTFRAWKKDVYINMTTNATLFDEKKLKFVVENLDEISISLDGLPMVHDKNRITIDGRGTFKVVSEYIDELLKSTVKIIARMTVTHETVSDLYNGVVYLYNKGFNVISPIIDQGDEHWNEETMEKLKRQLIKLSDEFCNKQNIQIGLLEKIKYQKKSKCLPGDITMHIDTDGVIYPCAYTVGDSKFQMGNVTIGIDNNRLQKIRDINHYEFESCVLCNWKEFCCGYRCKLINYKIYGTFEPQYTECKLEHILLEVNKYRKRLM